MSVRDSNLNDTSCKTEFGRKNLTSSHHFSPSILEKELHKKYLH